MMRRFIEFLPANNREKPPVPGPTEDPVDREEPSLDTLVPDSQQALRHQGADPQGRGRGRFLRAPARSYAQNIVVGFARMRGLSTVGVVANQPMVLAGCLDIESSIKAGAFRALLRLLQHSHPDLRRRARLHARVHRPGVRRHHQARAQAALRLRRGDGPESHADHPQGIRRRLRRHELQASCAATSTSPGPAPRSP